MATYDAPINGSNFIYLNGTTQSVPYPVLHELGSEIHSDMPGAASWGTVVGSYTRVNSTDFNISVTSTAAEEFPFLNMSNTLTANLIVGTRVVYSFDTVVNSGTAIINDFLTGNERGREYYTVVQGYNEVVVDVIADGQNTWVYFEGTNLFDISVTNWTIKEITLPIASYLTYFSNTTNTLTELSSTGDVGENLATNGDFTDWLTDWVVDDGGQTVEVVDGRLHIISDGTYCEASQAISGLDSTRDYNINFDVEVISGDARFNNSYDGSISIALTTADNGRYIHHTKTDGTGSIKFARQTACEYYIDNVVSRESLPVSTTYSVTDSHQFVFSHTSPLSASDVSAIEADPNLAFRMFLDGEVLPSGFSNTDVGWFSGGNEGLASAEKVYDLSDQAFLTFVSIVDYDVLTRTTLDNQPNGASNLKLIQDGSGRTTGIAVANTTQWEADGRTAVTGWTITAPFTITEETNDDTYTYLSNGNRYKNNSPDGTYPVPTGIWILDHTRFDGTAGVTKRGNTKMVDSLQIP